MAFCAKCGKQLAGDSKFCTGCGAAVGGTAQTPVQAPAQASGMRTAAEVENFYRNTLKFQEKYIKSYRTGINKLVNGLIPGEAIEFATHCIVGGLSSTGVMAEVAATNRRFIIATNANMSTTFNRAKRGMGTPGLESYRYETFSGITAQNGLLTSSVIISFFDGTITLGVDKKWLNIVYKGLSASFYQHMGG